MKRSLNRRSAVLLIVAAIAFMFFERSPGADAVRAVQILLLLACGACIGVALTLFRTARQSERDPSGSRPG